MLKQYLENVRKINPLIHNITNYVTVNDCANMLLACGASPIMADDINEVEEITSICSGLNINIGTLNTRTIEAMHKAGIKSNELGHIVVLDPVGVGASSFRTNTVNSLIKNIKFTVIRGNISEIKNLALENDKSIIKGVDANVLDIVKEKNINDVIKFAKKFSKKTGAIIAITGAIDIVANYKNAYIIFNGEPMMSKVTGTGCQLSSLITAYVSANPENSLEATVSAICAMGICGEKAYKRKLNNLGNSSYRDYIIDEMYNLTGEELDKYAKYNIL